MKANKKASTPNKDSLLITKKLLTKVEAQCTKICTDRNDMIGNCVMYTNKQPILAGATRQAAASTRSRYKPTKHVSPTGNMCESLFSVCKHTMTDYRRHMGPEKLEATLILRCNYDLWQGPIGQKLIQEIMNEEKAARKAAADQARNTAVAAAAVAAVAADDELDEFSLSGITDDTEY